MTDHEPPAHEPSQGLLAPGPSALVALTLAVLVLMGNNLMVAGAQSLFGTMFTGTPDFATFFVVWVIGAVVPAGASILLARRAISIGAAGSELLLGRAAIALAVVGLFYTLLLLLGALIHMD
jgi:hypothetical protein